MVIRRESPDEWWFAVAPDAEDDRDLAVAFGDWIDREYRVGSLVIDGPGAPAAWRQVLAERGFEATGEAWAQLWLPLAGRTFPAVDGVVSTSDRSNVVDRVNVHRSAFRSSTFSVDQWETMAGETIFDPRFDLLARDDDGTPVSAATFWMAGPGKCARLEPMGTHADHRRKGHGKRLITAACALLADAGASGISVTTQMSNEAAVSMYRSAGFRLIDTSIEMHRAG